MPGPFLQAALTCERVLFERDGTLSLIRVIDRIGSPVEPTPAAPVGFAFQLVVMLKFGAEPGPFQLVVRLQNPAGETSQVLENTLERPDGPEPDLGVNVHAPIQMLFQSVGTYWFLIFVDGRELTRVAFTVSVAPPS